MAKKDSTVARYLEALGWVKDMRTTLRSPTISDESKARGDGSVTPNPVHGWAEDLVKREMRFLRDRAVFLEDWMDDPRPAAKRSSKARCKGCGRGLARGVKFCSQCGEMAVLT